MHLPETGLVPATELGVEQQRRRGLDVRTFECADVDHAAGTVVRDEIFRPERCKPAVPGTHRTPSR